LAHNHGSAYREVLGLCRERPELGRTLDGSTTLRAEVVHAAGEEMAVTLADVAFRRTDLCTAGFPSVAALREAARLMAETCGWDQLREVAELDHVIERLALARTGRALLADGTLPRVATTAGAA
jgi:glycerol-3-phosphate dehydrogenase